MKTEAEAKTCWCPFARIAMAASETQGNQYASNRKEAHSNCLASACMVWRWGEGETEFTSEERDGFVYSHISRLNGEPCFKRPRGSNRRGYCGLAGESR